MAAPKIKPKLGDDSQVQVKHVAAYPIPVQVSKGEGQPVSRGKIVKLAEHGFMMKIDVGPVFKVAEEWKVVFEPPTQSLISVVAKVVKTYDAYEMRGKAQEKIYTIEMHFKSLTKEQKDSIDNYLVNSGQKKRVLI